MFKKKLSRFMRDSNDSDSLGAAADKYWQPSFLNEGETCGKEYMRDWRSFLVHKNLEQITGSVHKRARTLRFLFYSTRITRAVFETCRLLKQPPEVRYMALDILDRFLIQHFFSVARTLQERDNWSKTIWRVVRERMVNQSYLRILSSIQIASKYCTRSQAVTTSNLQKVFNTLIRKYNFSRTDLIKSEVRIMRTLQFNIPIITPLTYVEMFLEELTDYGLMKQLKTTMDSFLTISIRILDVAFAFHKEIFQNLFKKTPSQSYYSGVKHRLTLRIEAVILTATTILDPSNTVPGELLEFFSLTTEYNAEEIVILSSQILEVILDK